MAVRHPRPPILPTVVAIAVLGALIAAAAAIAGLPLLTQPSGGSQGASAGVSAAADASGAPVAGSARPVPDEIGAEDVYWAMIVEQPLDRDRRSFELQGGTLGDPAPVQRVVAPFVVGDQPAEVARTPVAPALSGGAAYYVADDGTGSQIRRATLSAPLGDELIAELDEVISAIAVAPDGRHLYAHVIDRVPYVDAGVLELALDGSNEWRQVIPALPVASRPAEPVARLVAVAALRADLVVSTDSRHLGRWICTAQAGCRADIVDLESGETVNIGDRTLVGIADGRVYSVRCGQRGCEVSALDLATGDEIPLVPDASSAMLLDVSGTAVLASFSFGPGGGALTVIRVATGESSVLLDAPAGASVQPVSGPGGLLQVSAPPGWLVLTAFGVDGQQDLLAVPVDGRDPVELPQVPINVGPPMQG